MYRDDVLVYNRTAKGNPVKKTKEGLTYEYLLIYAAAFFISRAVLLKNLMPFGIAFIIAVYSILNIEVSIFVALSAAAGYLSLFNGSMSICHALVCLILILVMAALKPNNKKSVIKLGLSGFILNFIFVLFINYIFKDSIVLYNVIFTLLESIIVLASAYIFTFGVPAFFSKTKRTILSKEEMICLSLIISLFISGFYDFKTGFSIRNILAIFFILVNGFVEGADIGAAYGLTFGMISSISYGVNPAYLGVFGICGVMSGIFKEHGKALSTAAVLISGMVLAFTINEVGVMDKIFMDISAACIAFVFFPKKKLDDIAVLVNSEKVELKLQQSYIERVKDLVSKKMNSISATMTGFSKILEKNIDNELSYKIEMDGMVENLACRVCYDCDYRNKCWKNEIYFTYSSFIETLSKMDKKGKIAVDDLPEGLERKCIKPHELIKQANYLFEIYRINDGWKKRLVNSKKIVSQQINGIAGIMDSMIEEISASVEFRNDVEKELAAAFDKRSLDFSDVLAVKNNKERYEVTVYRKPCAGKKSCMKGYAEAISSVLQVKMKKDEEYCRFNSNNTLCQFRFVEAENYQMISAVAKASLDKVSGDNYSFGEISSGSYLMAISDGMGNGARAAAESEATISMLEKFLEAGFERDTIIKAVNSALAIKACGESYATIDMGIVDLYSGVAEFIKAGCAATFIKSGNCVYTIKSSSLPAGILDEVEIESDIIELKNGDIILMVSDGIIDADEEKKEEWVIKTLKGFDNGNPKEIAEYILNCAKGKCGDRIKDDMTVLVSKIWGSN